jgi:hypothetical protein
MLPCSTAGSVFLGDLHWAEGAKTAAAAAGIVGVARNWNRELAQKLHAAFRLTNSPHAAFYFFSLWWSEGAIQDS